MKFHALCGIAFLIVSCVNIYTNKKVENKLNAG